MKKVETENTVVRRVAEPDVNAVVALVHELAAYEQASEQCRLTPAQLRTALFGEEPALFGHVAEVRGAVVGCALWFLNYSTVPELLDLKSSHGIYLEDLYVQPGYRGRGLGRALLAALAAESCERGFGRLEWSVLDWNQPAIDFYEKVGAMVLPEWRICRMTPEQFARLAEGPAEG